jgi:hypothetical protein
MSKRASKSASSALRFAVGVAEDPGGACTPAGAAGGAICAAAAFALAGPSMASMETTAGPRGAASAEGSEGTKRATAGAAVGKVVAMAGAD